MGKYSDIYIECYSKLVQSIVEKASQTGTISKDDAAILMQFRKEVDNFEKKPLFETIIDGINSIIGISDLISGGGK